MLNLHFGILKLKKSFLSISHQNWGKERNEFNPVAGFIALQSAPADLSSQIIIPRQQ
jgi:hypothetical protein